MKSWRALAAVPAALALAVLGSSPAHAAIGTSAGDVDTTRANVISLDALSLNGAGVPVVTFTYTCVGTKEGFLWISLKQPRPDVPADWDLASEGTSNLSKSWDSKHTTVPCSGTSKAVPLHATITVEDEYAPFYEAWHFSDSPMTAGDPTFVQLCLTMPAGQTFKAPGYNKQLEEGVTSQAAKAMGLALNYSWVDL